MAHFIILQRDRLAAVAWDDGSLRHYEQDQDDSSEKHKNGHEHGALTDLFTARKLSVLLLKIIPAIIAKAHLLGRLHRREIELEDKFREASVPLLEYLALLFLANVFTFQSALSIVEMGMTVEHAEGAVAASESPVCRLIVAFRHGETRIIFFTQVTNLTFLQQDSVRLMWRHHVLSEILERDLYT